MKRNINSQIKDNLLFLNLKNSYNNIDNYLKIGNKEKMTIQEFLNYMLEKEAEYKKERCIEMKIQMAGFPFKKTFDTFEFNFQPNLDLNKIEYLKKLKFIENKENIIFMGNSGVGKTHLAIALATEAIRKNYSTYFINCISLIEKLQRAKVEGNFEEKLKIYSRYDVLVIDEIGYLPTNVDGANLFFKLILRRYEKKSTIFTTNKPLSKWTDIFKDPVITMGIVDRIIHHCTTIKIEGSSYRLMKH